MKTPPINTMRYRVDILAGDASTVLDETVPAGVEDLTTMGNKRLEMARAISNVTTHIFTIRYTPDLVSSCYFVFNSALYAVDYITDPGTPFRQAFLEVYAHQVQDGFIRPVTHIEWDDGSGRILWEDGNLIAWS